jgi:hypothetical protein
MRIIYIPKFRAVSSGLKTFEELFSENGFLGWLKKNDNIIKNSIYEPEDFMWHEGDKNVWIWAIKDEVTEHGTYPYETIEFKGGIFLIATADEKDNNDINETVNCMMEWIKNSDVFEYGDFPKSGMSNMPKGREVIDEALDIAQQQIFLPLKFRIK